MPAPLMQQVLDRCRDAMFTGILRVRSRQAEAEVWFLSGILEWLKFGVSVGDEGMTRLLAATNPKVEVIACLPSPSGGFRQRATASSLPLEGRLSDTRPVDLLRFCETHALTCRVELASGQARGEAAYRLGELVQIRCEDPQANAGSERAVAAMLDWSSGDYRVVLPSVELPPGVEARASDRTKAASEEHEEAPAESEAEAWRKAMNEAVKRKAEAVIAKLGPASEAGLLTPPPELTRALPEPPAAKAKAKAPAKKGKARPSAVVIRVQRVRTEEADIRVPLTEDVLLPAGEDGTRALNVDALFAEAVRLSKRATVKWRIEGAPRVQVHPMQSPPEMPLAGAKKR